MKITVAQYAKSLYAATLDKSAEETDVAVLNFVKILEKNNQIKARKEIIREFQKVYNAENGIIEAEITSREKLSEESRGVLRKKLSSEYEAKEVVLKEKINEAIKGGIIIRIGEDVLDGSIERKLKELRKNLAN